MPARPFPQVAEWLIDQALIHQRRTLHSGTPGDNITIMVVRALLGVSFFLSAQKGVQYIQLGVWGVQYVVR